MEPPKSASKIPKPKPLALQSIENTMGPDSSKRKSEDSSGPRSAIKPAKRFASAVVTVTAPSDKPQSRGVEVAMAGATWEEIAAATGLTIDTLLRKKMTGKTSFDLKGKAEMMQTYITQLRSAIRYLGDSQQDLESRCAAAEARLGQAEAEYKACLARAGGEKDTLAAEVAAARHRVRSLESRAAESDAALRAARDALSRSEERCRSLESRSQAMEEEAGRARRDAAESERRLAEYTDSQASTQQYVLTLQEYNTTLREEVQAGQEGLARLRDEKGGLIEAAAELRGQVQAAQQRLSVLEGSLKESDTAKSRAQEESYALRNEVARLQQARTAAGEEVAQTRGQLGARISELEALLRVAAARAADAERGRDAAASEVQRLSSELAAMHAEASRQMDGLRGEVARVGGALEAARAQTATQELELVYLRSSLSRTSEEAQAREAELARTRQEKARLEAQERSYQDRLEAATSAMDQLRMHNAALQGTHGSQTGEVQNLIDSNSSLHLRVAELERSLRAGEAERRRLHGALQDLKGNVRVYCRVRPLGPREAEVWGGRMAVGRPVQGVDLDRRVEVLHSAREEADPTKEPQRHTYSFDKVFGPEHGQEAVFEEISQLVQSSVDGHKVCIFAYGQTGSGKTHTMFGTPDRPGMIPRALDLVFDKCSALLGQGWRFELGASMLEVYNEEIYDLGQPGRPKIKCTLQDECLRELRIASLPSPQEAAALVQGAMGQKTVHATLMNDESSRSHCVFQLFIRGQNGETSAETRGVLNLIDLAGSERLRQSGATGDRKKETEAINSSLLTLKKVVRSIRTKAPHVPFRESVLTRLLEPCMKPGSKVLMFVNVSPAPENAYESLNSLNFANEVNNCEVGAGPSGGAGTAQGGRPASAQAGGERPPTLSATAPARPGAAARPNTTTGTSGAAPRAGANTFRR